MTKESKEILTKAISDCGYWQWWDEVEDDYMVEFGGVLMYDDTKEGNQARSSVMAIGFFGNAFLIFLDNEDMTEWYNQLHNDEIDPFTMDPDGFVFDDKAYASEILRKYSKSHGGFSSASEAKEEILNAKNILAATCGDYGFIIGGDVCKVFGAKDGYSDDDIRILSKKWWDYWRDYWEKRNTEEAYELDYACEVTIPFK